MKKILSLVLCLLMVLAVMSGCGNKEEAPPAEVAPMVEEAAPAAAPAAPAVEEAPADPAGDASGEMGAASGEASGEAPAMREEAVDPTGYTPDFAGYQQYALTAVAELEAQSGLDLASFKSEIEAAADETAAVFANMQSQNTIVAYADFLAAN